MNIHRFDFVKYQRSVGEWCEAEVLQVTHIRHWWYFKLRDVATNHVTRATAEEVQEIPEYAAESDNSRGNHVFGNVSYQKQ